MNWNKITPSPPPFALLRTPPMSSTLKLIVSFSLITCAIYLYIHMYMYRYMNSICWIQCNVISPETIYTQITRLLILKSHPGSLILLTLSHLCLGILSSLFFSHFLPLLSFSGPVQSTDYVQCATFFSLRWTFQDTLTALPLIFTMKTSSTIKKKKRKKAVKVVCAWGDGKMETDSCVSLNSQPNLLETFWTSEFLSQKE